MFTSHILCLLLLLHFFPFVIPSQEETLPPQQPNREIKTEEPLKSDDAEDMTLSQYAMKKRKDMQETCRSGKDLTKEQVEQCEQMEKLKPIVVVENEEKPRASATEDYIQLGHAELQDIYIEKARGLVQKNAPQYKYLQEDTITPRGENTAEGGPGEMGTPLVLTDLTPEEQQNMREYYEQHNFNAYISDRISVRRSLPDYRWDKCKEPGRYSSTLPPTSVVICFYNEAWSTLLRTVHSVLNRTPDHLLQEVLLIDDFSSMEHLKLPLDDYMAEYKKVRIIHAKDRLGIAMARKLGAIEAKADIVTYLDAHCEVTQGWIEPLLDIVHKEPKAAAVPIIDVINAETFEFFALGCEYISVGGFNWLLGYTWRPVPARDRKNRHPCDSVRSPTMAGGLFSIRKDFFEEIGHYDENMEVWGGENVELSLRIWMCGGSIEFVPCSHVGHVFRPIGPYAKSSAEKYGDYLGKNLARVAEAWLDDRKKYYYATYGDKHKGINVSHVLAIREKLQCHSFEWFLDNVYPEMFVPDRALAYGYLESVSFPDFCVDSLGKIHDSPVELKPCHKKGGNQQWFLSQTGEIRTYKSCLEYTREKGLVLVICHDNYGTQSWRYNSQSQVLYHPTSKLCLAANQLQKTLFLKDCTRNRANSRWRFQHHRLNRTLLS